MESANLLHKLKKVEHIAGLSKLGRLLYNPLKYLDALFFRKFIYSKSKKDKIVKVDLFFDEKMDIALPASTDIYLTGGKSHDSEIRLAKFIIKNLNENDSFLDIGAHFGYFSLLASKIVGNEGKVLSFEPASKSFNILKSNCDSHSNITIFNKALSTGEEPITFFEFPTLFSEYNTSDVTQFEGENWYNESKPIEVKIEATAIDILTASYNFNPKLIKMDVEGAENDVIIGGKEYLKSESPVIVMEYLSKSRHNTSHVKATNLLRELDYCSFIIKEEGGTQEMFDLDEYIDRSQMESDNIVFIKIEKDSLKPNLL